ncbi:uncharacterized protein LOC135843955 [Planococcus citri]|uniref:uncharacterized protein LOC135843955 n=1 Tax=Planococcus citri TaxID=170843 RepID=UPI0031F7C81E
MCLTDLFRIPSKKSFKKCPSFGKKKKPRKLSRTPSTAPILRSSILKSTCNIYTLATLNSLRNTNTTQKTTSDSDGTDYTKSSSTEYESFEDSKQKQLEIHLPQRTARNGIIDSVARSPLLEAAVAGQLSAIQWFLKHTCCTLNEKDTNGCNILHLAAR